ncbi:unnamed protein product [Trichogramma brassicae]|uniref:Uncharacterized protein n=1 Tax=Trichogramma brassicae TaxID=86971 RepID=A0A6H5IT00_9HYME|nr:unnamed protein product [Trichogramma brassicae]
MIIICMTQLSRQCSGRKQCHWVNSYETSMRHRSSTASQMVYNGPMSIKRCEHVSEKCMRKDLHKIIKSLKALLRLKDIDCGTGPWADERRPHRRGGRGSDERRPHGHGRRHSCLQDGRRHPRLRERRRHLHLRERYLPQGRVLKNRICTTTRGTSRSLLALIFFTDRQSAEEQPEGDVRCRTIGARLLCVGYGSCTQIIPEVARSSEEPVFLIDFPDWESLDPEEREILNFTLDEPIGFDSDGEPIYEDSLDSEEDSDDDSIMSMFHWTIDALHIDELFAMKRFVLHNGRVQVEFYYQEVRVTIDNELIATLDRNLLCHEERWDDSTPACTWCANANADLKASVFTSQQSTLPGSSGLNFGCSPTSYAQAANCNIYE